MEIDMESVHWCLEELVDKDYAQKIGDSELYEYVPG
jgi:hypothetical protein